jgi:DNA polymerase-1
LVDKEQQKIICEVDKKIWDNLYNPHVWTTLELGGFKLDTDAWRYLAEKNQEIVDALSEKLSTKYGVEKSKLVGRGKNRHEEKYFEPFNLNSPAQVKTVLKDSFGLDLESTDDDHIRPYYDTNPFVKDILDFRKAEQGVSKYGLPFLKNVEEDGRIYTSLNIALASTGRDSSSSPALQNIEATKERRKCFIAGEGKVLVLYDYSGQEANLFAYNTQDPLLKEIINSGKKLYLEVARMAFDEIVVKDSPRYKIIKALVLGLMYGLTPYGFARDNGVSKEVAEDMFERFFDAFPVAAQWIHAKQARNMGVSKTIIGRSIHLHPYDNQWKNNSLNDPQQGSAGDMIKLAMKKLRKTEMYKKYHPDNKLNLILQVHDEIITEVVKELAEEWSLIMKQIMIDVAESLHPGIRGGVSGGIINTWAEKE